MTDNAPSNDTEQDNSTQDTGHEPDDTNSSNSDNVTRTEFEAFKNEIKNALDALTSVAEDTPAEPPHETPVSKPWTHWGSK